jgi:hypothetical protein
MIGRLWMCWGIDLRCPGGQVISLDQPTSIHILDIMTVGRVTIKNRSLRHIIEDRKMSPETAESPPKVKESRTFHLHQISNLLSDLG